MRFYGCLIQARVPGKPVEYKSYRFVIIFLDIKTPQSNVLELEQALRLDLWFVQVLERRWRSDSIGGLILGMFISFLFSALSVGFPFYKDKILNKDKIQRTIAFGINYLLKILIMFIVMSMNAWVCIAVIVGMTTGQIFFQQVKLKQVRDHVLESWIFD